MVIQMKELEFLKIQCKALDKLCNEIWNRNEIKINDIKITRMKCGTPIDVDCDENDIFERVLHLEIDYVNEVK